MRAQVPGGRWSVANTEHVHATVSLLLQARGLHCTADIDIDDSRVEASVGSTGHGLGYARSEVEDEAGSMQVFVERKHEREV